MDKGNERILKFRRDKLVKLFSDATELANLIGEVRNIINESEQWRQHYQGLTDDINAEYWDDDKEEIQFNEMDGATINDFSAAYMEVIAGLQDSIGELKKMVEGGIHRMRNKNSGIPEK
ncbi:MAG: hypothetical protein WC460_06755 [Patescibacteria group bacterium]